MGKVTKFSYSAFTPTEVVIEIMLDSRNQLHKVLDFLDEIEGKEVRDTSISSTPSVEDSKKKGTQEIIDGVFEKELKGEEKKPEEPEKVEEKVESKDDDIKGSPDEDNEGDVKVDEEEEAVIKSIKKGNHSVGEIYHDLKDTVSETNYGTVREIIKKLKGEGIIRMEGMRATSKYYIEGEQKEQETAPEKKDDDWNKPMDEFTDMIKSKIQYLGSMMGRRWKHSKDDEGKYRIKWDEIKIMCKELSLNYNDMIEHLQCDDAFAFDVQKECGFNLEMSEDNGKPTIVITGKFNE